MVDVAEHPLVLDRGGGFMQLRSVGVSDQFNEFIDQMICGGFHSDTIAHRSHTRTNEAEPPDADTPGGSHDPL